MKKLVAAAAFSLALAIPATGAAQAPYLGLRVAYGIPSGDAVGNSAGTTIKQTDLVSSVIPLQLDAGFIMGPIDFGAYLSYGFGKAGSSFDSAYTVRVGAQGNLHSEMRPGREVWAGVFLGYERLKASGGGLSSVTAAGWEGGLQGGFDFTSPTSGFGPYVSISTGQYSDLQVGGTSESIGEKKFHETFVIGVRGFFKI